MPNYSKGKIYTIRCRTDDSLIYVGSTIQTLSVRLAGHKGACKLNKNSMLFDAIRKDKMGWDNWYIELYEYFSCNNKEELQKQEGIFIREFATLNKQIAGRTQEEYRTENADKISKSKK